MGCCESEQVVHSHTPRIPTEIRLISILIHNVTHYCNAGDGRGESLPPSMLNQAVTPSHISSGSTLVYDDKKLPIQAKEEPEVEEEEENSDLDDDVINR